MQEGWKPTGTDIGGGVCLLAVGDKDDICELLRDYPSLIMARGVLEEIFEGS